MATPDADAKKLDDVLLAMDVVDTLRHRDQLLAKELDAAGREETLIKRLREIYDAQGIEVPDTVLREGVKALEEHRFTYTPPKMSVGVMLAKLYVGRDRWLRPAMGIVAAAILGLTSYQFGIAGPAKARAEATQIALAETLPAELVSLRDAIQGASQEDRARTLAEAITQEGMGAIAAQDAAGAAAAVTALKQLQSDIAIAYDIRIISRPGERSGIYRIPDDAPNARNYYLLVEAVDARGRTFPVTIRSEEDQQVKRVTQWGQRVTEGTYNAVAADKQDDQIIQNAVIGRKAAGFVTPTFTVDTQGGAILKW